MNKFVLFYKKHCNAFIFGILAFLIVALLSIGAIFAYKSDNYSDLNVNSAYAAESIPTSEYVYLYFPSSYYDYLSDLVLLQLTYSPFEVTDLTGGNYFENAYVPDSVTTSDTYAVAAFLIEMDDYSFYLAFCNSSISYSYLYLSSSTNSTGSPVAWGTTNSVYSYYDSGTYLIPNVDGVVSSLPLSSTYNILYFTPSSSSTSTTYSISGATLYAPGELVNGMSYGYYFYNSTASSPIDVVGLTVPDDSTSTLNYVRLYIVYKNSSTEYSRFAPPSDLTVSNCSYNYRYYSSSNIVSVDDDYSAVGYVDLYSPTGQIYVYGVLNDNDISIELISGTGYTWTDGETSTVDYWSSASSPTYIDFSVSTGYGVGSSTSVLAVGLTTLTDIYTIVGGGYTVACYDPIYYSSTPSLELDGLDTVSSYTIYVNPSGSLHTSITYNGNNVVGSSVSVAVDSSASNNYTILSLVSDDGYVLPSSIEVTGCDYTYYGANFSSGSLLLYNASSNGAVTVSSIEGSSLNVLTYFIEPVQAFMDTDFFGTGFSFSDVFNVVLFVSVALIFLKMFAGG